MLPAVIKEPLKKVYFAYLEIKAHRERVKSDRKAQSALIHHEIIKQRDRRARKIYSTVCFTDEQKKAIDELYLANYGEKVPYIWHQRYTAYTGQFDACYFPELLYIPEFEYYMNMDKAYCRAFSDKNVIPVFAKLAGVSIPRTIVSCTKGLYRDGAYNAISKEQAVRLIEKSGGGVFVKPSVDACSGHGCMKLSALDDLPTVIDGLGVDFVVQDIIKCHSSIEKIYSGSVNTFRIITYRWKDQFLHMPIIMRIGQGGNYLDNAHAGGMFIAVDDDGILHKTAFTEFRNSFDKHPDTGVVFEGYRVSGVDKVIQAAERMHHAIPQIGCVNWDFTVDQEGNAILIEANMSSGSIWLIQMAHG